MNNKPLLKFCAHLGHVLNTRAKDKGKDKDYVACSFFYLEQTIIQRLAHKSSYRTHIVGMARMNGQWSEANPEHREQAAERWIIEVLDRPMKAKAGRAGAKPHALARALGARAVGPERRVEPRPLPDELSVLQALRRLPPHMHLLKPSEESAFVHLLIQAIEAANVRWGRLVWIGLCPWTWRELTINQVKSLGEFYNAARKVDSSQWPAVWDAHPVTRFKDFDTFIVSELGHAIRQVIEHPSCARGASYVSFEDEWDQEGTEDENINLDDENIYKDVMDTLEYLENNEYINSFESRFYIEILKGNTLADLMNRPWVRKNFESSENFTLEVIKKYTDTLSEKITKAIREIDKESPGN